MIKAYQDAHIATSVTTSLVSEIQNPDVALCWSRAVNTSQMLAEGLSIPVVEYIVKFVRFYEAFTFVSENLKAETEELIDNEIQAFMNRSSLRDYGDLLEHFAYTEHSFVFGIVSNVSGQQIARSETAPFGKP